MRHEEFFRMLFEIAKSSVTASQAIMESSQDMISDLIDFTLGNTSPRVLAGGEKRVAMGGTIPPPFRHLYSLISFLIRMTHTSKMDLETRLITH